MGLIPGNTNYPGLPALTSVGGGGNGPHSGNSGSASPYDTGSGHGSGNPSPSPAVVRMLELANNGIGQVSPVGGSVYPNSASSPNANHIHVNANQQQQMMSTSPNDSGGSPIPPSTSTLPKDHPTIPGVHSNQHLNPIHLRGGGGMSYSPMKTDNGGNHVGQPELLSPHHSSIGLNAMYGGVNTSQNHTGSSAGGIPPPPVSLAGDLAGSLGLPSSGSAGSDLRLSHPAITQWLQQAQQAQQAAAAAAAAAAGGGEGGRLGIVGPGSHSPPWIKKDEPKDEPMDREQSPQSGTSSEYATL